MHNNSLILSISNWACRGLKWSPSFRQKFFLICQLYQRSTCHTYLNIPNLLTSFYQTVCIPYKAPLCSFLSRISRHAVGPNLIYELPLMRHTKFELIKKRGKVVVLFFGNVKYIFLSWCDSPQWARASSFARLHDHTQTRHTRQDSSGGVVSPTQRPIPNTQHSQETDIHATGIIRTRNLSKRVDADLRLRPRCHWDLHAKRK